MAKTPKERRLSTKLVKADLKRWDQIKKDVLESGEPYLKVGVLAGQGGEEVRDTGITMLELAAIHEFGSPKANIPERSFIRRTLREKREQINRAFAGAAKSMIEKRTPFKVVIKALGEFLVAQVRNTITGPVHIPPPLQPATIRRKGSDRPLVDTGRLVQAISYEVVDK